MKKKGEVKVVINYPMDKEKIVKVDKIKMEGLLDIVLRSKNIDTIDKKEM